MPARRRSPGWSAGPAGTPVTLTVIHPGEDAPVDVTITRQTITVPAVSWAMVPGTSIADIRISQFSSGTGDQFVSALRGARQAGATGVVLDLRNNPGGYVDEAVERRQPVPEGGRRLHPPDGGRHRDSGRGQGGRHRGRPPDLVSWSTTARRAPRRSRPAHSRTRSAASCSERARYGTGTVLNTFGLSDGSAIRLGVEEWLTPSRRAIFPNGILPDQEVNLMLGRATAGARRHPIADARGVPRVAGPAADQRRRGAPEPMTDASLSVAPVGPVTAADRERRVARLQARACAGGPRRRLLHGASQFRVPDAASRCRRSGRRSRGSWPSSCRRSAFRRS